MNEFRWVGNGPDRTLFLGLVPRISIDPRIRCPRTFTKEFPSPPTPTVRYGEIALRAARKILGATWPFRAHVEVIKVGYALGEDTPINLYITGDVVLVVPGIAEKVAVGSKSIVGAAYAEQNFGFSLGGGLEVYERICTSLADQLVLKSKSLARERDADIDDLAVKLQHFKCILAVDQT